MQTMRSLISHISQSGESRKITGLHILAAEFFDFLIEKSSPEPKEFFFCAKDGLILSCRLSEAQSAGELSLAEEEKSFTGRTLDFASVKRGSFISCLTESGDYALITKLSDNFPAKAVMKDLSRLLAAARMDENGSRYLLSCLNSVKNSISIYDKNAVLLFANSSFCKDMSVADADLITGLSISEILRKNEIKIQSMGDNSSNLKMMDVLSTGSEAIDWEVRIESKKSSEQKIVSNDMYPVFGPGGEVKGLVEVTHSRQQDIRRTRRIMGLTAEYNFEDIIGDSEIIKEKIFTAKKYSDSPFSLLITGESGVGKELFAQSIHNYSPRRKGPFVALNCANFSDSLIESELFGYVGGAFTGASKNGQIGKFELADGGTLFLDEIGELPLHFQSKLLRVLETWTVTRIGSNKPIPVNVRLISATNRNLAEMVEEGLFRQDLYYRLQVLTVEIPPLRQRKDDLIPLSQFFLNQAAAPYMDTPKILDAKAKRLLLSYDWHGNVRELRNVINRATILSKSRIITADVLEEAVSSKTFLLKNRSEETPKARLDKRMSEIEASYVNLLKESLDISEGNKSKAAELIGVSRKTFYRMLEKYGL